MSGSMANLHSSLAQALSRPPSGQGRGTKEGNVDRDKMLDVTLQQIEKQFGRGAVMKLGEHPMGAGITVIPTGSLALDIALGVGGIPKGRVVEVFGPEGSGKTTVCLHIIAEAQAKGGIAAFIDAEHALDPTYARELGVNIDELLVSQPDSGEQALEIADMLVRSAALDLVVIDSVAALVPRAEIEGEMGDTHVGLQARLMSQAMRKLSGSLSRFDTTAIFINQLREKIGVMFGSPETTPGGRALKFYSTIRLDVRKIENLKDGTEVVGSRTRVKVVKNKVAPPFRQCEFDIMYGKGISKEGSLIDVGVDLEIVKKSGAWFTYEGDQLGQGRENARQFLAEHIDLRDEIERKVREAVGLTVLRRRRRRADHASARPRRHRREEPPMEESPSPPPSPRRVSGVGEHSVASPARGPRTPRAATSAPSGSWPSVLAAAGSWSGGSSAARFEPDEVRGRPDAAGAGRAGGRRGLRPAVRGAAVRLPQGGQPGGRAGPPRGRHRPGAGGQPPPKALPTRMRSAPPDLARLAGLAAPGRAPPEGLRAPLLPPDAARIQPRDRPQRSTEGAGALLPGRVATLCLACPGRSIGETRGIDLPNPTRRTTEGLK